VAEFQVQIELVIIRVISLVGFYETSGAPTALFVGVQSWSNSFRQGITPYLGAQLGTETREERKYR